jgi:hypothetical protein
MLRPRKESRTLKPRLRSWTAESPLLNCHPRTRSMRKYRNYLFGVTVLASSLFTQGVLTGCFANRELLLETPLPQSYFLASPPNKVWKATLLEASKPARRILANDEETYLLSWVNEIESAGRLHASLTDPEIESDGDETIAIAVVRIEPAPGGSRLTIRLTYCSAKAFAGVSSSRGNYEQEIFWTIRKSLISEAASHEKNY